ncbi:uncharacterized protein NKAPD1-like isoform X2 [Littorina saxatilis]|uniref:uncharacterized protein NKAPD1-like isoform X2 n=1 Tax=Littorina saxatilis TaxID=31220 RepID=UPI0038B5FAE7
MAGVFSTTTKTMLKNVIRHTTSHNKVVEESEMWQQRGRLKTLGGLDPSNPSYGHDDRCDSSNSRHRNGDYWNSKSAKRSQLSTVGHSRHAHMDDDVETRDEKPGSSTSTYWMRQLDKLETGDPNRWDHSGFKEMYPHDFNSDRSDSPPRPLKSADRKKKTKSKISFRVM